MFVSRVARKCILGGSMPLSLKDAHSREAAFVNERLTGALILPPNGREGRTSLDERDEVLVITPQVYGSRLSDHSRVGSQLVRHP